MVISTHMRISIIVMAMVSMNHLVIAIMMTITIIIKYDDRKKKDNYGDHKGGECDDDDVLVL